MIGTFRRVELAVLAYVLLATGIAAVRLPRYGNAAFAVVAHLLIAGLVLLTVRAAPEDNAVPQRGVHRFRDALPLLLLVGLYPLLDIVNMAGGVRTWDAELQRIEQGLFAMQPSRDWWRASPSMFWSTLLHAAYFSYYPLIAVPAFILLRGGTRSERTFFVTRVTVTFMLCYAVFALLPVSGPYYQFERPTGSFIANLPAQWVYASLTGGSSFGAAFPSSHVAATVTAVAVLLRVRPRLGAWLVVPAVLLSVSVVYCAMHYAVDAIVGLAVGLVVGCTPRTAR